MAADKVPALRNSAHLPAQDSSDFFRSGASQAEAQAETARTAITRRAELRHLSLADMETPLMLMYVLGKRANLVAFARRAPAFSMRMQYNHGVGLHDVVNETGPIWSCWRPGPCQHGGGSPLPAASQNEGRLGRKIRELFKRF